MEEEASTSTSTSTITPNERMLANMDKFGDVTFSVGPEGQEEEVKGVLFVLRSMSTVFETMFNEDWMEQQSVIRLPDIDPEVFRLFLKLLLIENLKVDHLEDVKSSLDGILHLVYIANKYDVAPIQSLCRIALRNIISVENAISVYESLQTFNEPESEKKALDFITANIGELLDKDSFLDLSQSSLMQILNSDQMTIQELTLFHGVCRWAHFQCMKNDIEINGGNIRTVLGDAIFLIRFPLIPFHEFFETVEPMGILNREEIIEISRYNAMKDNPSFVNNSGFSAEKRSFLTQLLFVKAINPNFQQCYVYTPSVQICLERVEVGSFGWDNPHRQYNVKLCISDGTCEILPIITKTSPMFKNKFEFDLDPLVILEPNKRYYICYDVKRKGSDPLCKMEIYHNTLLIKVH